MNTSTLGSRLTVLGFTVFVICVLPSLWGGVGLAQAPDPADRETASVSLSESIEPFRNLIAAELLVRPKALAENNNARPLLKVAAASIKELEPPDAPLFYRRCLVPDNDFPSKTESAYIRRLLAANTMAMTKLQQGLQRASFQFEPVNGLESVGDDLATGLLRLNQLLLLQCRLALADEKGKATRAALQSARLGQLAIQGEGNLKDFTCGLLILRTAAMTSSLAARQAEVSEADLVALRRAWEKPLGIKSAHAGAVRTEFRDVFLPLLGELAEEVKQNEKSQHAWMQQLATIRSELKQTRSGAEVVPLDIPKTLQLKQQLVSREIKDVQTAWFRRKPEQGPTLSDWQTTWNGQLNDAGKLARRLRVQAADVRPAERKQLETAWYNCLGRKLLTTLDTQRSPQTAYAVEADVAAARLTIASRHFLRKQQQLPADLAQLVSSGVLSDLPPDPFTGQVFGFDPRKKTLSSPGPARLGAGRATITWSIDTVD